MTDDDARHLGIDRAVRTGPPFPMETDMTIIAIIATAGIAFTWGLYLGVEYGAGTVVELFDDRRDQLQAAIDDNGAKVL